MAINLMCMNSKCKFYWEDCCTKSMNEEHMVINANGTCETFEAGESDWYQAERDSIASLPKELREYQEKFQAEKDSIEQFLKGAHWTDEQVMAINLFKQRLDLIDVLSSIIAVKTYGEREENNE